jgi:hypothetical protein
VKWPREVIQFIEVVSAAGVRRIGAQVVCAAWLIDTRTGDSSRTSRGVTVPGVDWMGAVLRPGTWPCWPLALHPATPQ